MPAVLLTAAVGTYLGDRWERPSELRAKRKANGLCVACGYDLTGNVSGVCPECGRHLRNANP